MIENMNNLLTASQAYKAMQSFLENYYKRTHSDDVGSLLGDMQLTSKNETFDPAAWDDWMDSVNKVLNERQSKSTGENR